jgi:hypothetical protein
LCVTQHYYSRGEALTGLARLLFWSSPRRGGSFWSGLAENQHTLFSVLMDAYVFDTVESSEWKSYGVRPYQCWKDGQKMNRCRGRPS